MYRRILIILGCIGLASVAAGQAQPLRATISAHGNSGRGKCIIEVVVDGSAEIEISGDSATIRNHSGPEPHWRRFECSGRMPANPVNFLFSIIDGPGRQQLIRDPQNGGVAIVKIEDKERGAEVYTFELIWDSAFDNHPASGNDRFLERQETDQVSDRQSDGNSPFGSDQALYSCQKAIRDQAVLRFSGANLAFRTTALDGQSVRRDLVVGTFEVRRGGRSESYRFTCLVSENGRIRSTKIEPRQYGRDFPGAGDK